MFMKKFFLMAAVAALTLASCSSDEELALNDGQEQAAEAGAVGFDAYTQRGVTRAGYAGTMNISQLQKATDNGGGFGVFGYYTDNGTYDQQQIPDFMYNQLVTWNSTDSYWSYSPVKYWPNEYGKSAVSDDVDKVSFFAYAPYVEVAPATGKAVNSGDYDQAASTALQKWGISALSRNNATGDPLVKYIASFDQDKSVDLCWGVCDNTSWPIVVDGTSQSINGGEAGLPWRDVQRPADPTKLTATTGQKVKFTFKHATAQLYVDIDAFVDGIDNSNELDSITKIYVRSVTFEGFATKGTLNLNNTEVGANKAYWLDFNSANDLVTGEEVTVYDGRKDGKEGSPSGVATNEKSLGLNPALIQSTVWNDASAPAGVTNSVQALFRKLDSGDTYEAADAPIYVIPTGDPVKVTIAYDVETADPNLSTYVSDGQTPGSSIQNVITKDITFGSSDINTFENGKSYTIHLHLGMNSVKFDAAVTDWVETSAADVDLPANIPVYAARSQSGTGGYESNPLLITLPWDVTSYTFAVSGLKGYEAVTGGKDGTVVTAMTSNAANASGVAVETATLAQNKSIKNTTTGRARVDGTSGGEKIAITQEAHPLGLSLAYWYGNTNIFLSSTSSLTWATDVTTDNIRIWKNGVELTKSTDFSLILQDARGNIQLLTTKAKAASGDVYTITIKAGDAPEETITVKKS